MIDVTQLSPDEVKRLWEKARPYVAMSDAEMAGFSEGVVRGMTVEELERPRPAQDAPKLADLQAKPDLAEAERAEFDRVNEGDRFDGLS